MKLSRTYEIVAPLTVFEVWRAMRWTERRKIEEFLQRLARQPSLAGEFEAPAEDGRVHQVKIVGGWLVAYWIDHAVREVRVSNIEGIE